MSPRGDDAWCDTYDTCPDTDLDAAWDDLSAPERAYAALRAQR